jgi:hypothetical protein
MMRALQWCLAQVNPELAHEELLRRGEGLLQSGRVVRPTQAKVREVVEVVAEDVITINAVLSGVEDVGVPHLVD